MIPAMPIRLTPLLASLLGLASVVLQRPVAVPWPPTVERLPSPAPSGSAQPQLSVSDRGVILSWVEKEAERATLKFSERTAAGLVGAARGRVRQRLVRELGGRSLGDAARRRHARGALASEERSRHIRVRRAPLLLHRRRARRGPPSFTPHSDGTKTEHGFASLFQMPGAGLGLVWLDGRAMKPDAGHGGHGAAAGQ